jgi:DNA-binding ferritin-like protein
VKDRKVFGQAVGNYQNTRYTLAELQTEVQVARVFKELDDVGIEMNDMLKVTLADYEKLAKEANDIILMGQEKNDDVTVDMYTSILAAYHKTIWMLKTALK